MEMNRFQNVVFLLSMFKFLLLEERKRPGQRRMAWSAPTEIKEIRKVEVP